MTTERWQRVKAIFDRALECDPAARAEFLRESCGSDEELRREVESLLASYQEPDSLLNTKIREAGAMAAATPPRARSTDPMMGRAIGNYIITGELARGGMGIVYRARHVTLPRNVVVKCIRPVAFSEEAQKELRARFRREAHIQSQLDHPHIVRVYEFFSGDEEYFLVMEYVPGSSIRSMLDQRGSLPAGEASALAVQALDGLAHAHGLHYVDESGNTGVGIIHRDIKPSNLLVDERGNLKLTDFGIVKVLGGGQSTKTGSSPGTVDYMSPEQIRSLPVDARSDLYSLGVTLYEMLTGRSPFQRKDTDSDYEVLRAHIETDPPPIQTLNPDIPSSLADVVARSLKKDPNQRWQTAVEFREALIACQQGGPVPTAKVWGKRLGIGSATAVLGIAVAIAAYWYLHRVPILTERDSIVLADFTNTTGDPVFDSTLREALSIKLNESPFLNTLGEQQMAQTLRMMRRKPDDHLTPQLGREICQRRGLKAVVSGSIAQLGNNYVLSLEATNCATGEPVARTGQEVGGKNAVLRGLGKAAMQLRDKLGESLGSIQRFDKPFEATSSSLEALKSYSMASKVRYENGGADALALCQRAVELDPDFASAYARLSALYRNKHQPERAAEYGRKAFELRDRVTESEKFNLQFIYFANVTGQLDELIQSNKLWSLTYPRNGAAFSNLAQAYGIAGDYENALAAALDALRLNPDALTPYNNAMGYYAALGRFDEAKQKYEDARKRNIPNIPVTYYNIAFLRHDTAAMAQAVEDAMGKGDVRILGEQALTEAYFGRVRVARELFQTAVEAAQRKGNKDSMGMSHATRAQIEALVGLAEPARRDAEMALKLSSTRDVLTLAGCSLAFLGKTTPAQMAEEELRRAYPLNTIVTRVYIPALRASMEIAANKPDQAVEALQAAAPYELGSDQDGTGPMYAVYLRGEALLRARQGQAAAAEFQKIVDHPGIVVNFPLTPLSHLGLARAYAIAGQPDKSRAAYKDFFTLWKDADADLPILQQAHQEYAKIIRDSP